jgi:hypothetical protein
LYLDFREDQHVEGSRADLIADGIYEVAEGDDGSVVPPIEFNWFDDMGIPPWWICSHMTDSFPDSTFHEWTHTDAMMLDPVDPDRYLWILARWPDSIVKIDRQTHAPVTILGGAFSDVVISAEDGWSHPHMSPMWDGGFILFNNNSHGVGPSDAREYAYDGQNLSLTHVWHTDSRTLAIADARKLPNGNALIAVNGERTVEERTPDDELVWRLSHPDVDGGRVLLLDDLYSLGSEDWIPK